MQGDIDVAFGMIIEQGITKLPLKKSLANGPPVGGSVCISRAAEAGCASPSFASLRVDFLREPEGGIVSDIMGPQEDFHSGPTWRRQVQIRHGGA